MILGNKGYLSVPSQQNTGEGKSMYIGLSFLFVTIRRIISNRIRYFYEKWTPITIQCHVYAHLFHVTVP